MHWRKDDGGGGVLALGVELNQFWAQARLHKPGEIFAEARVMVNTGI